MYGRCHPGINIPKHQEAIQNFRGMVGKMYRRPAASTLSIRPESHRRFLKQPSTPLRHHCKNRRKEISILQHSNIVQASIKKILALILTTSLCATSVTALPPLDIAVENPPEIMSFNARAPLAPRLALCGACCSPCSGYGFCCKGAACERVRSAAKESARCQVDLGNIWMPKVVFGTRSRER